MAEPKFFSHLVNLYKVLEADAVEGEWVGSQREAFDSLGLSAAYNPKLYRALRGLGCIETIVRGAGGRESRLRLIEPPQIERFREWDHDAGRLTHRLSLSNIESRLASIEQRLPNISLADWIVSVEARLEAIEREDDGKT